MDYAERCKQGEESRIRNPNLWFCLRCNLTYYDCKHHHTPYANGAREIFVLCVECWNELTPEQRVPYYVAAILAHWPPKDHHFVDEITAEVLKGN